MSEIKYCSVEDCSGSNRGKQRLRRGMCRKHYARFMRLGSIDLPSREDRFWSKVKKNKKTGCWEWKGSLRNGYGVFDTNEKCDYAHRFSYILKNGKIPKGKVLDHLCVNRKCVNPDHLEAVTQGENLRRALATA